jgi:hypothetical protein
MIEDDLEAIASRLDDLAEQLSDLAISTLREALDDEDGDGKRPEVEKRITKARRSLDKAAALLRSDPTSTLI